MVMVDGGDGADTLIGGDGDGHALAAQDQTRS